LIESIDVHSHTHAHTHTHSLSQLLGHVHFNTNGIDTKSVAAFAIRYFWRRTHFVPSDATLDDHLDTTIQAVPPVPIQPPQQYWRAPVLFDRVVATRHRPARHQVPQTPNALRQPINQPINQPNDWLCEYQEWAYRCHRGLLLQRCSSTGNLEEQSRSHAQCNHSK
jgi:hypothetical protein